MKSYNSIERLLGAPIEGGNRSSTQLQKYEEILPAEIIQLWRRDGWCGYLGGTLWFVNPDDYIDILAEWTISDTDNALVFARTAFADLFLYIRQQIFFLDVQYGDLFEIASGVDEMVGNLADPDFREDCLKEQLFSTVHNRMGLLQSDECYMFVPVLALGGSGEAESVQKGKIREHLYLLSQVVLGDFSGL